MWNKAGCTQGQTLFFVIWDMIPGPKSAHVANVLFTHMHALYTNKEKKVTNTDTHHGIHTNRNTLMVMNNISYESYQVQHLVAFTPFGSTSKQKVDHHKPSEERISVPKRAAHKHWSNHSPPWSNKPKEPSKPSKPHGNLALLNQTSHVWM